VANGQVAVKCRQNTVDSSRHWAMFSNQETPVLIVIHEENGIKDYDEPKLTIKKSIWIT